MSSKIAFIFTHSKDEVIASVRAHKNADTSLHGLNHIPGADHFAIHPTSLKGLAYVPTLLRYDFIVAQDHLMLGFVVSWCARLIGARTKWLYFDMTSSTLLRRYEKNALRRFLLALFWRSYAHIICITSLQKKEFIELGIRERRLTFIPFPIDADFFTQTSALADEGFVFSVGLDAGRDYPTLTRAAEHTREKIVIACLPRNIPEGLSIPENVSVLYGKGLLEVRDLYARARLVAVVSKDISEPSGSDCSGQTVVLEALAAGKAVVATYRPWITDYLVPGEDLIVVPPHDPEALARAIDSLAQDEALRKRLVASGKAKVLALYTTKVFTGSLMKLMESLT